MCNKTNFYLGMGMGLVAGSVAGMCMRSRQKKHGRKSALGNAVRSVGEVAESISDMMGW